MVQAEEQNQMLEEQLQVLQREHSSLKNEHERKTASFRLDLKDKDQLVKSLTQQLRQLEQDFKEMVGKMPSENDIPSQVNYSQDHLDVFDDEGTDQTIKEPEIKIENAIIEPSDFDEEPESVYGVKPVEEVQVKPVKRTIVEKRRREKSVDFSPLG